MKTNEFNNIIVRYGVLNGQKKELESEVKELGAEIKEEFEERGIEQFEAVGYVATVGKRISRRLNVEKLEKLLGRAIPADCFDNVESEVLTIKAVKNEEGKKGKQKAA